MQTKFSRLLLATLTICVLSSAAEAKEGSKRRRESRESSKNGSSDSKREGKIKACEASPTKYWDYFSKRCMPIPK